MTRILDAFQKILARYWGFAKFRPLQREIIASVFGGKDTLALMPTGGGKSLTFQIPALAKEGMALVITPLIALMQDQTEQLKKLGIKALAVHAGMTQKEIDMCLDNAIYGDYKFLYVSPERLETELFRARLPKMNINLIAVDEAHCISQWGYDFRPSYLRIADVREALPDVPILALTATATSKVADDIQEKLEFKEKNLLKKSFERKNLVYLVRETEDKEALVLKIVKSLNGSGIIYARTRRKTRELSNFLNKNNVNAQYYNAGLKAETRQQRQKDWTSGKARIMVATNAFGMGIDKADVRFVVHVDPPDSPEAYFQEAGRAGRDEKQAFAVLVCNDADKKRLLERNEKSFPDLKEIKRIYNALGNYLQLAVGSGKGIVFDFRVREFASKFKFDSLTAYNALKVLQQEGYLELTDELNNPARLLFTVKRDELYSFQLKNEEKDRFIKLILRSYTGVFNNYTPIDEKAIGRKSGLNQNGVYKNMVFLAKQGIISYIPQKTTPLLVMTEERLDDKSLRFSKEKYDRRKNAHYERTEAMIKYASSSTKCRSQYLLQYFGQKNAPRCGVCDVCRSRNELNMSRYKFDLILDEIKMHLEESPKDIKQLAESCTYKDEKVIKVTRWLLDNGKITQDKDGVLKWK